MDYQTLKTNLYELTLDGANDTISEITQQPQCWEQIPALLDEQSPELYALIAEQLNNPAAQITFCGAGTSAYVGDVLVDAVQRLAKARVRSLATTHIVSRPDEYFHKDSQGIVFAFGRSGNSPESVDTADKVSQIAPNVHQINVTCNPNGELSKRQDSHNHVCLMPPETHDKTPVADCAKSLCEQLFAHSAMRPIPTAKRLVYLGSNTLYGATREAALKALEMTAGKVVTMSETSLGFRHGPKSIVDDKTTVCLFVSNNSYTQQFDRDMAVELLENNQAQQVVVIGSQKVGGELLKNYANSELLQLVTLPDDLVEVDDVLLAPLFVLVSQIIGLCLSFTYDISPDNPCPTGEVNRVVQGVTLYDFKQ